MDGSLLGKFFGQRAPEIPQISLDPNLVPEPPKQENKNKSSLPGGDARWSNFDPTGLERAAAAAKELDRSSKFPAIFSPISSRLKFKNCFGGTGF